MCSSSGEGSRSGHTFAFAGIRMLAMPASAKLRATVPFSSPDLWSSAGSPIVSHSGVATPGSSVVPFGSSGSSGSGRHPPPEPGSRGLYEQLT